MYVIQGEYMKNGENVKYVKCCCGAEFGVVYNPEFKYWTFYALSSFIDKRKHEYLYARNCYDYMRNVTRVTREIYGEWLERISIDLVRNYGSKSKMYQSFIKASNSFFFGGYGE